VQTTPAGAVCTINVFQRGHWFGIDQMAGFNAEPSQ
jgi:hypothetical protein